MIIILLEFYEIYIKLYINEFRTGNKELKSYDNNFRN